jgi:antitoxin YefM
MRTISYAELSKSFKKHLDLACDSEEAIIIRRTKERSVVMISLREYNSILATAYLLSTTANADRLAVSLNLAAAGIGKIFDPTK